MEKKKFTKKEQRELNRHLFDAVLFCDLPAVKDAVEAGADINTKDKWDISVLRSSMRQSVLIMEYLLENEADPNIQNKLGETVLHDAAWNRTLDHVKLLLKHGADLRHGADMYLKDNQGYTPYAISIMCKKDDIAEFLLSQGYVPSEDDLQVLKNRRLEEAIKNNDLPAVRSAIESKADINSKNRYGKPMLQTAIDKDIEIAESLLEAGADPDIQDSAGETALHKTASTYYYTDKVKFPLTKLLLKYKADMYIKDGEGRTPFDISLLCGCYDIAELFISNGYVPSDKGMQKVKNHRLLKAVKESDLSAVKAAVEDGADVNATKNNGEPLLLDADFKNSEVMRYLLENKMNPNMRDTYGMSLLHQFASEGKIDSIKLLLEFGSNMYLKDGFKETSFAKALKYQAYDIAEYFILNEYIPAEEDFSVISDLNERASVRTHFMTLLTQVQEHKERLKEEVKTVSQEFAYADEIMEI